MCSQQVKTNIHNTNRIIIALLSLAGFLWDGFHTTDLLFSISIVLWLWQPEWDKLEEQIMDRVLQAQTATLFS